MEIKPLFEEGQQLRWMVIIGIDYWVFDSKKEADEFARSQSEQSTATHAN